jgi:hypothetical protein
MGSRRSSSSGLYGTDAIFFFSIEKAVAHFLHVKRVSAGIVATTSRSGDWQSGHVTFWGAIGEHGNGDVTGCH